MSAVITVFGSSRPHEGDPAYEEARRLGAGLASRGFVVCSGGYGGVMAGVSRGACDAGGHTIAVTAEAFRAKANQWVQEEIRVKAWEQRLFELIHRGAGYVACAGGTGTLVELAVVWEMLNKSVMPAKPFVALGGFWLPIVERVREVEMGHKSEWGESGNKLIHFAQTAEEAAEYLSHRLSPAISRVQNPPAGFASTQ